MNVLMLVALVISQCPVLEEEVIHFSDPIYSKHYVTASLADGSRLAVPVINGYLPSFDRDSNIRHYWYNLKIRHDGKCVVDYSPSEAPAILGLCMRGKDNIINPVAVRIADVENFESVPNRDVANATILFDKAVPNGQATLVVDLQDGRRARIALWPIDRVELGQPTIRLAAQWSPEKDKLSADSLKGRSTRYYSSEFPLDVVSKKKAMPRPVPVPQPVYQFESDQEVRRLKMAVQKLEEQLQELKSNNIPAGNFKKRPSEF